MEIAEGRTGKQTETQDQARADLQDPVFLAALRRQMVKFASLQMNDHDLAEDAVQDALITALKKVDAFAGRSALRTWVFAILKHKIADIFRQRRRLVNAGRFSDADTPLPDVFSKRGFWKPEDRPKNWGGKVDSIHDAQFWAVFEACLEGLPAQQGRVFMMREFIGLEADEICSELALSLSNLYVILHRARLRLRECLENKWFDGDCPSC